MNDIEGNSTEDSNHSVAGMSIVIEGERIRIMTS